MACEASGRGHHRLGRLGSDVHFAITAGIGFASTNVADTTLARAGRTTPAIEVAQGALADAKPARDRECSGADL